MNREETAAVINIIELYAPDKGEELRRTGGAAARGSAAQIYDAVVQRLHSDPEGRKAVEAYAGSPTTESEALAEALDRVMSGDEEFARRINELMNQYDAAAGAHAGPAGVSGTAGSGHNLGSGKDTLPGEQSGYAGGHGNTGDMKRPNES